MPWTVPSKTSKVPCKGRKIMNDIFADITGGTINSFIEDWKKSGRPVVGYTCTYVPLEILHAAGILPVRLRGLSTERTSIGDAYFGPFICSLPKCILQSVGEKQYRFLDGVIIIPGCDSMRRLDECWRKAGDDIDEIIPEFFYHLSIPHKLTGFSLQFFIQELQSMIDALSQKFGVEINERKLNDSISLFNRCRELMTEVQKSREEGLLSGSEALRAVMAASMIPRGDYISLLEQYLSEIDTSAKQQGPRIMLAGSACDDVELMDLIEQEGCHIVADTLCYGLSVETAPVSLEGDPLESLARRYLGSLHCPRMYGAYRERRDSILAEIERAEIDGVILQNIRFCDLHGSENGLLIRDLESTGIPCLKLEREYGPLVEKGRMKMRLQAFFERLSENNRQTVHREGAL
jgi:benzoyl-CoA reductase/2-hydroxyglutaryl-CoA dehydratase subunit BcrC/BadD/HgdB